MGDTLIVQYDHVWFLDSGTGELKRKIKVRWGWGTPVLASIGGTDVFFTCKGDAVRVSDGKVLASKLAGKGLGYNGPVRHGDRLYFIQADARACRLPAACDGRLEVTPVWRGKIKKDRYYGCPLVHEGLVYAITQKQGLSVLDDADGSTVYTKKVDVPRATVYQSITLGGRHLFISNEKGHTVVVEPGREYKEVARNSLEPFRSCPVFRGARIYIRARKHLYCIGR